jgi:hypothetical protein
MKQHIDENFRQNKIKSFAATAKNFYQTRQCNPRFSQKESGMVIQDQGKQIEIVPIDMSSSRMYGTTTQSQSRLINYEKLCDDLSNNIRREYRQEPA